MTGPQKKGAELSMQGMKLAQHAAVMDMHSEVQRHDHLQAWIGLKAVSYNLTCRNSRTVQRMKMHTCCYR